MPKTIKVKVYLFEELGEKEKERARNWHREAQSDDTGSIDRQIEHEIQVMLRDIGFADTEVHYSIGYTQSDGASFEGSWSARTAEIDPIKIKVDYPEVHVLHNLAEELLALKSLYVDDWRLLTEKVYWGSDPYQAVRWIYECDEDADFEIPTETFKGIRDSLESFARWIYARLREIDMYDSSDESIANSMAANEYTFMKNGKRFG